MEVAVKDSPLWRHRSSITTSHPVEMSWERNPGNNSGLNCWDGGSVSDWMAPQHLSLIPFAFCLLQSLNMTALGWNTEAYFHTLTSCINWARRLFHPASSFGLYSIFTLHKTLSATKDPLFGWFSWLLWSQIWLKVRRNSWPGFPELVRGEKPWCIKEHNWLWQAAYLLKLGQCLWCDYVFFAWVLFFIMAG